MNLESTVQSVILSKLRQIPDSFWVKPTKTNMAGCPDILGHIKGHFIAIEIKREARIGPSEIQQYRIDSINKGGGYAFWGSEWLAVKSKILQYGKQCNFYTGLRE